MILKLHFKNYKRRYKRIKFILRCWIKIIIFGTNKHLLTIKEEHCDELYKYIWDIIKNKNCKLYRINGVENHIHILSDLHPSISLADYVKN